MELLYLPFQLFILFPPVALAFGFVFLILFLIIRKKTNTISYLLFCSTILWFVYGLWEIKMSYWSKTVIAPIRVDLIFIVPLLYAISVAGFISYYRLSKS